MGIEGTNTGQILVKTGPAKSVTRGGGKVWTLVNTGQILEFGVEWYGGSADCGLSVVKHWSKSDQTLVKMDCGRAAAPPPAVSHFLPRVRRHIGEVQVKVKS